MSGAPERIWAWGWMGDICTAGQWQDLPCNHPGYIRVDLYTAAIARAERAEQERDRFESALGRACLVGGTTYMIERAERAEAALALLHSRASDLLFCYRHGNGLDGWHKAADGLEEALAKIAALKGGAA